MRGNKSTAWGGDNNLEVIQPRRLERNFCPSSLQLIYCKQNYSRMDGINTLSEQDFVRYFYKSTLLASVYSYI